MIPFTLRQLTYFVAAAEHGSVAEAAKTLNVSQPSVSAAIAKLEDQFGVQLFLRHHAQGVSLTQVGEQLVVSARSLLAHASEIRESARELGQEVSGGLSVGCFVTMAPLYMPKLIREFTAKYPTVEIALHEGYQEALFEGLDSGRFDLAVLYDVDLPDHFAVLPLLELPPYALLPARHPLARQSAVSLADLAAEPLVLLDQPPSREYFTGLFRDQGFEPRIAFHSPSLEMVRGLVGTGHGCSILVTRPPVDRSYDGSRIAVRPIADTIEPGRIGLARLAAARPTRLVDTFSGFARDYFARFAV